MNQLINSSRLFYAVAIGLLGVEHLITGNFPVALLPVSPFMPGRLIFVYCVGVVLVTAGLCIVLRRKDDLAAAIAGILFLLFALFLHLPKLLENPRNGGAWTVFFELAALAGGAFMLAGNRSIDLPAAIPYKLSGQLITYGRSLFTISLVVFGIQHFQYASFVATLVTAWIPGHLFWAYFVGVAFLAAALSIVLNRQVSLAMSLLGTMFLLWVILLHAPRVIANWHTETEWTSLFIALAMSGISFFLAGSTIADKLLYKAQNDVWRV